jgi:hemoglobin
VHEVTDPLSNCIDGGTMDATVDIFYGKFLTDGTISHLFATTNMKKKRVKQKTFVALAFGGLNYDSGLDMRAAHAPLVSKGLNDDHFNTVTEHRQAVLEELGVDAALIFDVMEIAGGTRNVVLIC